MKKKYKPVALNILMVVGTLLLMMMPHTSVNLEKTLYSKIRVFLYIPYCIALIVYTTPDGFAVISRKSTICVVVAAFIVLIFSKIDFYLSELNNQDSELYHSYIVAQEDANSCFAEAEKIVQLADDLGVQSIAFRGNSGMVAAYATAALSYGRHEVYRTDVDRRYYMRDNMNTWTPRKVVIITYTPSTPEGWTYSVDYVEDIRTATR